MEQDQEINDLKNRVGILEVKYDGIKERLDKIDGGINRLTWIFITGVLVAILNFILKGGLPTL